MRDANERKPKNRFESSTQTFRAPGVTHEEERNREKPHDDEVSDEIFPIESESVFSALPVGKIPEGNPGKAYRKSRTGRSIQRNQYKIQWNIEHEADEHDFQPFLYFPQSGKNLKIDLQKEIKDHERRRPGEDFSGFRKFFSKKRNREVGSEKCEGERDRNGHGGEIFRKELPYRRDLSFVIASGKP